MGVIYPINTDDKIILVSGAALSEDQKAKLILMEKEYMNNLLWDLQFGLLSRNVYFKFDTPLTRIDLHQTVYCDKLNKNIFMDEVNNLHTSIHYIFLMLNKYIVDNPKTTKEPPKEGLEGYI